MPWIAFYLPLLLLPLLDRQGQSGCTMEEVRSGEARQHSVQEPAVGPTVIFRLQC